MRSVSIYDSTLRDGAQGESISFSVQDKLNITKALDELGVDYIEAGNPGSNPKDMEFFTLAKDIKLAHAKLTAFGSTRHKSTLTEDDVNIKSLLKAETPCVTIFGKSWDLHVREILKAELCENIQMIYETVAYLKKNGKEVVYDAEHFFDGYKANSEYALDTLKAAKDGGADLICLCDTNGGSFPEEIYSITKKASESLDMPIGIHTHDDMGMAVANSCIAVEAGACQVQGTLVGFGERCGNAALSSIIGNLQLKKSYRCIPSESMAKLTELARKVAEISNIKLASGLPYVGKNAFTHKAGMHADGVMKLSKTFEHVTPESVGNTRRFLMSEVAGRSVIINKVMKFMPELKRDSEDTYRISERIKELEYEGYQFEGAESSFELTVMKLLGKYKKLFELDKLNIISESTPEAGVRSASAIVKVLVGDKYEITAAEGDGPVNALDKALRKALEVFFPEIGDIRLVDYKVRVLDSGRATASKVRVLIESTDGKDYWTTVGVSTDIIKASSIALLDSIDYKLMKRRNKEEMMK